MDKNLDDPMHIYNVRAQMAVDQAEREMRRAIDREIDPRPERTHVGNMLRALRDDATTELEN